MNPSKFLPHRTRLELNSLRHFLGLASICFLLTLSTARAAAPLPATQRDTLKSLQDTITETAQAKKETEVKAAKVETDLNQTKQQLVEAGQSVQKNEKTLDALEPQITRLQSEKDALTEKLQKNRKSIASMILGLERIRRIPPEALIAKPGAPIKTAESMTLLSHIIPALDRQAQDVKASLDHLEDVTARLEGQKKQAASVVATMTAQQDKLKVLADKRQKLFASTHQDLQQQEESLKTYAAQAQNLQDLMNKIEEKSKRDAAAAKTKPAAFAKSKSLLPQPGNMRLPVAGAVLVSYGQPDDFGAASKGVTIESRPGAVIIAPMGGIVRFAGRFKNYGNMVIVEHKKGFHSLIAGLEKIDTVVGQSVSAGEPLGFAHNSVADGTPSVYYELRQNGEPVNPAKVFADLG